MLLQSKHLLGAKIYSLHTGQQIGQLGEAIINPHRFGVEAFYCESKWQDDKKAAHVLLTQDIREATARRILINSTDEITPLSELVRLQEIVSMDFKLIDKSVRTESKRRLGKVDDYAIATEDFLVQKIYVKQSILKSMNLHSLVVDRQQITEISKKYVTVSDTTVLKPEAVPSQAA